MRVYGCICVEFMLGFSCLCAQCHSHCVVGWLRLLRRAQPVLCRVSCLGALQIKLLIVFLVKQNGMKVKEYGKPLLANFCHAKKNQKNAEGDEVDWNEVRIDPNDRNAYDRNSFREEYGEQYAYFWDRAEGVPISKHQAKHITRSLTIEQQAGLVDDSDSGTFDEFLTMVIQFGFIALFAPACALVPLLAISNNVTEIRTDAYKFCTMHMRPHIKPMSDIGAWNEVRAYAIMQTWTFW
jgi:hypothetical protein